MPLVRFFSPQDLVERINARNGQLQAQAQAAQETREASLGKLDPATLDFAYQCSGNADFKPTEVFSGNGHVYLKMPDDMKYHDAPAVFDETGGATQLINSRLVRGYTVLDRLAWQIQAGRGRG
jgi:type IV secretory pathway VirB9-like protein